MTDAASDSFSFQFQDFLYRGGAFRSLNILSRGNDERKEDSPPTSSSSKRIILIEEFPSSLTNSSTALLAFRRTLLQYLAAAVPPRSAARAATSPHTDSFPPIVLIISESLLTSATAAADGFTAHRLLGSELCSHPYTTMIEFNPVAPTLINKALNTILEKVRSTTSRRQPKPGLAVLKRLSELGDIRNAVNGLEFVCIKGQSDPAGPENRLDRKSKKPKKPGSKSATAEDKSVELITQREATLGIFHAVGKVVWNKRDDSGLTEDSSAASRQKPTPQLSMFERPRPSQVDTDQLLNEIGTDIQTFTAALHENYALSTNGSRSHESAAGCMDYLSDSDMLSSGSRQPTHGSRGNDVGGSIDMLRQNEISFHVAVRGLLFSLPYPVTRIEGPEDGNDKKGSKAAAFKMFFPRSVKIWKPREEIQDLLSAQMARSMLLGDVVHRVAQPSYDHQYAAAGVGVAGGDSVEFWHSRSLSFIRQGNQTPLKSQTASVTGSKPSDDEQDAPTTSRVRIWSTRGEFLLDRLPYLSHIHAARNNHDVDFDVDVEQVRRITQLADPGTSVMNNHNDDGEGEEEEEERDDAGSVSLDFATTKDDLLTAASTAFSDHQQQQQQQQQHHHHHHQSYAITHPLPTTTSNARILKANTNTSSSLPLPSPSQHRHQHQHSAAAATVATTKSFNRKNDHLEQARQTPDLSHLSPPRPPSSASASPQTPLPLPETRLLYIAEDDIEDD